jgi:hypothetical protein
VSARVLIVVSRSTRCRLAISLVAIMKAGNPSFGRPAHLPCSGFRCPGDIETTPAAEPPSTGSIGNFVCGRP